MNKCKSIGSLAGWLLSCALVMAVTKAGAATQESFSVVSNGEVVGSLIATVEVASVDIEYQVSNNGRGPKLRERIELNGDGIPRAWSVDGTSLFGGAVKERFSLLGKKYRWQSQADRGEFSSPVTHLYAVNDGSPWSYGLYARALLQAPEQRLPAVPSGTMSIEKLEDASFGEGARTVKVAVYSITGLNLTPEYVLLDAGAKLFAQVKSGVDGILVRAGYEHDEQALKALAQSMAFLQLERLQARYAHRFDRPVRIRNVKVFDPQSGSLSSTVSVVIFGDRIASVVEEGSPTPTPHDDEVVIDGEGGTVVAGLHDMHTHNNPWSGLFHLAAGVTTVRDMGNDNAALLDLTARIDVGRLPGPHIIRAGLIEGRSEYSARIGVIPPDLPGGVAAVRWYAAHGYRQIKLYNSLNPDWVKPLAIEAHRLGMRVSGHVPAFMSPDRAIRDGYDEINHVNQLMLGWLIGPTEDTRTPLRLTAMGERAWSLDLGSERVQNTLGLMKEHDTALDTTAVILERLMLSRAGTVQPGDAPYLDHVPIAYQRYRKRSFVNFKTPQDDAHYVASMKKIIATLGLLHRQGVRLLPGTDDDTGFTLHRELELYVSAGIPPSDVLRMATLDCDTYLHRDQSFGSIASGKRADLILLDGDPTHAISAVRKVRLVIKDGAIYLPAELYAAVGVRPFVAAPRMQIPEGAAQHLDAATNSSALTKDMTSTEAPIAATNSRHRVHVGSQTLAYTAVFAEMPLQDSTGVTQATISSTSYLLQGVRDHSKRPVVFCFNGGPGASSSPLHFSAFGPRRLAGDSDQVVDNAETLLDLADLVFIDPVGTGFSRLRPGADPAAYWSVDGDAAVTLSLIRAWLKVQGREDSPVFIAGESYGGYRLATMAAHFEGLKISGLIFLSPMLDASGSIEADGNDQPFVFALPTMAAAAWQHEKVDRRGLNVQQFFDEAAAFAESDYLLALRRGSALTSEARNVTAARMAQFIGLPASSIAASNLRIDSEVFLQSLLPDRVVGRLDVRVTGPKPVSRALDRPPAADDPSLGLAGSNVIRSPRIRDYMQHELQVPTARDYLALTLDVNFRWRWRGADGPQFYVNATPNVAAAMRTQPNLRVLLLGGLFDLAVPVAAPRYALLHGGLPTDRVIMKSFAAGHSPFDSEESRAQVSRVVHEFLRAGVGT